MLTPHSQHEEEPTARRDDGATMVEYGLMLALVTLVCFSTVALLGENVALLYDDAAAMFN